MFIGFGAVVNCVGIVADSLAGMLFRSQTQKTKTFGEVPLSLSWFEVMKYRNSVISVTLCE